MNIVRVAQGHETLEGLKWSTLLTLLVFYGAMLFVGYSTGVQWLYLAYIFSVFSCALALFYKMSSALGTAQS